MILLAAVTMYTDIFYNIFLLLKYKCFVEYIIYHLEILIENSCYQT